MNNKEKNEAHVSPANIEATDKLDNPKCLSSSESRDSTTSNARLLLLGGYPVPEALYKSVLREAVAMIPGMGRGVSYTTEQICGKELWGRFDRGARIMAGRCMVQIVKCDALNLKVAKTAHEYPKRYELI